MKTRELVLVTKPQARGAQANVNVVNARYGITTYTYLLIQIDMIQHNGLKSFKNTQMADMPQCIMGLESNSTANNPPPTSMDHTINDV